MPGMFPETDELPSPAVPENDLRGRQTPRHTSFNFLRRGKSMERVKSGRSVSGGKLSKKQFAQAKEQDLLQQQREAANIPKPMLPDIARAPQMETFGGEDARPDSVAIVSNQMGGYSPGRNLPSGVADMTRSNGPHNVPLPPMPGNKKGDYVDPYARTESMTHRGRNSYASSAMSTINSPRRVRRRKDPTPFKYVTRPFLLKPFLTFLAAFSLLGHVTLARPLLSNSSVRRWRYHPVNNDHRLAMTI